jgi:nucleoid DNA-binding protein
MAKKTAKKSAASKARTKSEVLSGIAEKTGLTRKQVSSVFDEMGTMIKKDLTRGPGTFTVPGLMKVVVRKKPAQKAIKNWKNPFTGEIQTKPAKPASKQIKIRPLKNLKEMV